MASHWHYGFNMPGYMPDADTYVTYDWDSAYDALLYDINSYLDDMLEAGELLFEQHATDVVFEIEKYAEFAEPFYYELGKYVYWIEACDEKCVTLEDELAAALEVL